jgi:mono/diheme cytochrome c family protein
MLLRKILKIVGLVVAILTVSIAGLVGYASYATGKTIDAPFPAVVADRSPAGVARGAAIFHPTCETCHRAPNSDRAAGAPMHDAPDWLGLFYSANITSDKRGGIGSLSDAEVARMIRYGVNHTGHWGPMPTYALSDKDLAAVIGFLRSDAPLFRPVAQPAPRSRLSLAGRTVLLLTGALKPPKRPASGIVAPPRAPSAEYGRYLAESVYQCGDCHTPGYDSNKVHGPDAYVGGAEAKNGAGQTIYTPNLTKDENAGIGRWNRDQFAHAIRDGLRPDGMSLGYPMPQFRDADDIEVDALFSYLRSFPAKPTPVPGRHPAITEASPNTQALVR